MMTSPSPTPATVPAEVRAFVDAVRAHLDDLDPDVLDELVGGLEADLADQVADGTTLGVPAAYAAELRAAAGLPAALRRRHRTGPVRRGLAALRHPGTALDRGRDAVLDRVEHPRVRPAWDVLVALRPVWWVLRAWTALTLLDAWVGEYEDVTLVPSFGDALTSLAVLVAAVAGSVLIGLGRAWPGGRRTTPARLVLATLNSVAVGALLLGVAPISTDTALASRFAVNPDDYGDGFAAGQRGDLINRGRTVTNVFAYDEQGNPIPRVQLVDQTGRPLRLNLGVDLPETDVLDANGDPVSTVVYPCPTPGVAGFLRNVYPSPLLTTTDFMVDDVAADRCTRALVPKAAVPGFPVPTLPPLPAQPAAPAP